MDAGIGAGWEELALVESVRCPGVLAPPPSPPRPLTTPSFPLTTNPPPPPFPRGWGRGWMEAGYLNDVKDAAGPSVQCIEQGLKKDLGQKRISHGGALQPYSEHRAGSRLYAQSKALQTPQ